MWTQIFFKTEQNSSVFVWKRISVDRTLTETREFHVTTLLMPKQILRFKRCLPIIRGGLARWNMPTAPLGMILCCLLCAKQSSRYLVLFLSRNSESTGVAKINYPIWFIDKKKYYPARSKRIYGWLHEHRGKRNQIFCYYWLTNQTDGTILGAVDYPLYQARKCFILPNKHFIV